MTWWKLKFHWTGKYLLVRSSPEEIVFHEINQLSYLPHYFFVIYNRCEVFNVHFKVYKTVPYCPIWAVHTGSPADRHTTGRYQDFGPVLGDRGCIEQ